MGMNANVQDLIQRLSENDIQGAKRCALAVLTADNTASRAAWRKERINALTNQDVQFQIDNMPYQIKGLVFVEDVNKSFEPNRYYLAAGEREVLDQIKQMHRAAAKLDALRIR